MASRLAFLGALAVLLLAVPSGSTVEMLGPSNAWAVEFHVDKDGVEKFNADTDKMMKDIADKPGRGGDSRGEGRPSQDRGPNETPDRSGTDHCGPAIAGGISAAAAGAACAHGIGLACAGGILSGAKALQDGAACAQGLWERSKSSKTTCSPTAGQDWTKYSPQCHSVSTSCGESRRRGKVQKCSVSAGDERYYDVDAVP